MDLRLSGVEGPDSGVFYAYGHTSLPTIWIKSRTSKWKGKRVPQGCIHILASQPHKHDSTKRRHNYGVQADFKRTFLGRNPDKFRLRPGGFMGNQKGMVAIESISHPGFYLRHKNYRFHLQKPSQNELFAKDATFHVVKRQQRPLLYSFELIHHPSWLMVYNKSKISLGNVREQQMSDSTSFFIKQVRCKGLHKTQKKTVIVGSDTLVETDDDDDWYRDDVNDELDNIQVPGDGKAAEKTFVDVNNTEASSGQSSNTIIKVEQEPHVNATQKEHDIIREIKHAFKLVHSEKKQQQTLGELENDIDRKVNTLAVQLQTKQKNNEASDVIIKTDETQIQHSGVPEYRFPHDITQNATKQNKLQRELINASRNSSEPETRDKKLNIYINKTSSALFHHQRSVKQHTNMSINLSYGLNTSQVKTSSKNMINMVHLNTVEKGSPKLVNEIIARGSVARYEQEKYHDDKLARLVEYIRTTKPQQANKVSDEVNLYNNTRPHTMIFFSEKCDNVFPTVCEEWAKKRYCLTFNELMKRYCRKACKLCDHVITTGFTSCDKTCGGGIRLRMIKVNNRQVLQRRACNTQHCPIDGGYTPFSNFSDCSATCGSGLRYQHRTCTQPPPQFGGRDCSRFGGPVRTLPCYVHCKASIVKCKHQSGIFNQQRTDTEHTGNDYDNKASYQVFGDDQVIDDKYKMSAKTIHQIDGEKYSPYKLLLPKNENDETTVDKDCMERFSQSDYSEVNKNVKPGFYEYSYDDGMASKTNNINGAPQNPLLSIPSVRQATTAIGMALDEDSSELERSSLMQEVSDSPKATLSEELAAENEEALNEKRYEESVAQQSLGLRPY